VAGLSGTGRLADDLWLLAHHEATGRPHLQPRAAGLGLAGALLAELMLAGSIGLRTGQVVITGHPAPRDDLARSVLTLVVREPEQHPARDWLLFLGRTATQDVASRLEQSGYLTRAASRRGFRARQLLPADPDCAFAPLLWVKSALDPGLATAQNVTLAGLAVACGLGRHLTLYLPEGSHRRVQEATGQLYPCLQELIAHTQAAVDSCPTANEPFPFPSGSNQESEIMARTHAAGRRPTSMSRALAKDRLGVPAVLFFVLAGVAPLTVVAGVIPSAYATTGLTGIQAAFMVIAVILAIFATGYVAMTRHITNSGAFYAFIASGLGRTMGVAAALVALLSYSFLQVGLYGAFGPNAAGEAAAHLNLHAPWWAFALGAWAVVTVLGLLRVDITGRVLGVLLCAEITVIIAETVTGLAHPAGGHLSAATLFPTALTSAGFGTFGVLAVVAVLGFVGFEQAPVLAEEARNAKRTVPVATYLALGMIAVVYASASWAMAAHYGDSRVVAAAGQQGPGLLFGLGGSGVLSQAAQWLFLSSLFAAALSFHNTVWRYMFSLGRENVLPSALGRTGTNNIPKAASLTQSATALVVIVVYAVAGWAPMTDLFFWLGTAGGYGVMILLAVTAVAVITFFARDPRGESAWRRLIAPLIATILLTGIVILATAHYATLLGVPPGSTAAWALPASYAVIAAIGLAWGLILKIRRPRTYAAIGLGANAVTGQLTPTGATARP
jgi:amino acid transporter